MFKIKILLTAGFFINLFFFIWLIRLYSSLANFVYESTALQKALMYNYDMLYLNYEKLEAKAGSNPFALINFQDGFTFLRRNFVPMKGWVFDHRHFYEREPIEFVHVSDWFKRLNSLPVSSEMENINLVTDKLYWLIDKLCKFINNFIDLELTADQFLWLVLVFFAVLLVISYFVDPWAKRFDAIERRLYLHERFLEDKLHHGSPLEMKDTWLAKDEAFYHVRDMWKERAYYNINQNIRTDSYREPQPGQY
jgi:hypothetical protein